MLWRLAIVGFPFIVLLLIPGLMYGRSLISITRKIRVEYKEAGSIAEQAISLVRTVYAFGSETKLIAKFSAALEGSMKLGVTVRKRRLIEVADDEDDSDRSRGRERRVSTSQLPSVGACVDEDQSPAGLYRQGLCKSRIGIGQLF
ncbi:unnamed protein product [Brassica napus]|uniref:(rape) hypothetical protein n=1 Tax=Brassica napus TaxID=3708 RepID=A0A816MU32_BRANA|nr:unnamed protein product [Brassica napus]